MLFLTAIKSNNTGAVIGDNLFLNVSVEGVDGARLHSALRRRLALSGGSACSSSSGEPSHVLLALGRSRQQAAASVRFGLGRANTAEQVDLALAWFTEQVQALR